MTAVYLLEKAEFPANAVILATVSTSMEPIHNKHVTAPWLFNREATHRQFKFIVPGITLQLFTGKEHVRGLRAMCTARSPEGFIYMVAKTDMINMDGHFKDARQKPKSWPARSGIEAIGRAV